MNKNKKNQNKKFYNNYIKLLDFFKNYTFIFIGIAILTTLLQFGFINPKILIFLNLNQLIYYSIITYANLFTLILFTLAFFFLFLTLDKKFSPHFKNLKLNFRKIPLYFKNLKLIFRKILLFILYNFLFSILLLSYIIIMLLIFYIYNHNNSTIISFSAVAFISTFIFFSFFFYSPLPDKPWRINTRNFLKKYGIFILFFIFLISNTIFKHPFFYKDMDYNNCNIYRDGQTYVGQLIFQNNDTIAFYSHVSYSTIFFNKSTYTDIICK